MTRLYAYGAALILILYGFWYYGHTRYEAGKAKGDANVAAIVARDANELIEQKAVAAAIEKRQEAVTAAAERQMMQDNANAVQKYKDTIAALRAGTVRLRHQWTCPGVPAAAASAGKPDADTALREQGAADLIRLAADADAQIRALQAVLMGERK
ncbi:hypothetical protein EAH75_01410 [Rhodanobacter glycinis]|uniref:lysis system i-spanin subunit Rz n=1 Tax=Rhodanobacter glycinis TaxID=582702 RepID=UPI001129D78B|nr:lysis system i-spanin subunit Rz [Rhodanobacter glycinis]TPG50182.1 hypothetical protein EAH75_01410 [Rhodanobacter glycinis]